MGPLSRFAPAALALLLLAAPSVAAAQEYLPPGAPIESALSADLTEEGVTFLLEQVTGIFPEQLVVGTIPSQELVDAIFCTQNFWLENLVINLEVDALWADGTPDALEVVAQITVQLNDETDPANMVFDGCLDYLCLLHTDPVQVEIRLPISMAISADDAGDPFVDVTIHPIDHNIETAMAGAIHLTGCAIGEINEFLDQYLGFNAFDLVIGQLVAEVDGAIAEQIGPLEVTVEDALRALWLSDTIDVLDASLSYDIAPTLVEHNEHGLRLVLGGAMEAEKADCVLSFDDPGSPLTVSDLPAMAETTPQGGLGYHVGALVADDFLNQALYAAWRGGVLCYSASDLGSLQLTTSYLGLLLGLDHAERLAELVGPGETPIIIRTVPETQPLAVLDGPHDIDIEIVGLNIEFYITMADRFVRLASIAIDVDAGIDVYVDATDALALDIALDTSNLNPRVTYNEIAPDLNEALETNFPGFLTTVIDTVAGSLLEGMAFALPTFAGMGLVELIMENAGVEPTLLDFLGAFAILGESTGGVSSGGCDGCDSGGCDAAGCGGCDEAGCGDLEGCNLEDSLADSGCTGETSENPSDVGCVGCRILARREPSGEWHVVIDAEGVHPHGKARTRRIPVAPFVAVLVPVLFGIRRRRTRREF
jgi:hypothetical protein